MLSYHSPAVKQTSAHGVMIRVNGRLTVAPMVWFIRLHSDKIPNSQAPSDRMEPKRAEMSVTMINSKLELSRHFQYKGITHH